jgi:hypothetical protein
VATMNPIGKMRQVGDLLLSQGRFVEAYTVYDELYRQMWALFGIVQASLTNTAGGAFGHPVFKDSARGYAEPVASVLCARTYGASLPTILEEFQRVLLGHLECICSSEQISRETNCEAVLNEFAVFFVLALQPSRQRKITPVFAVVTSVIDKDHRLRRIRPNYLRRDIEKHLVDSAEKSRNGEWNSVNHLLLDYLGYTAQTTTDLYTKVLRIAGPGSDHSSHRSHGQNHQENQNNGRQEKNEGRGSTSVSATEREMKLHCGRLFGLKGVMTKSEVRSRYIHSVSLYHPDKVQHMGKELQELAEAKTKELNAAYEWLKTTYDIS